MRDDEATGADVFSIDRWDERGTASLQAAGADLRAALQATLRAVLTLMHGRDERHEACDATRSAPIRGEGDDPSALVADLIDDLIAQSETFGVVPRDIVVDGLLHRDRGGFVSWGYARLSENAPEAPAGIRLLDRPTVIADQPSEVVIRVSLARGQTGRR
jgi:hypothetical protein